MGENQLNEKSYWGDKIIKSLLLIVMVADLQQLNHQSKPVIYTWAFIETYYWCSRKLVYKTHKMVNLKNIKFLEQKIL